MAIEPLFIYKVSIACVTTEGAEDKSWGGERMWKERDDASALQHALESEGWKGIKDGSMSLVEFSIKFMRVDTWASGWFMHYRLDTGESDAEVLASFEEFVDRHDESNRKIITEVGENEASKRKDYLQMMGAEDRWRWCGSKDGRSGMFGVQQARTDAPCRCAGCKKQGVVMVCH